MISIRNPYKMAEFACSPFNPKPLTWAEKKRTELIKLRNKRIKLKKKLFLALITIFIIFPITLLLAISPAFLIKELNDNSIFLWGLCSGMFGFLMFLKTEDLLDI